MDRIDDVLRAYFDPSLAPDDVGRRLLRVALPRAARGSLAELAERLRIEATPRGVTLVRLGGGGETVSAAARRHAARARQELREYLAGERAFFSVPVDLTGVPEFQARVLAEAGRVGFGEVVSYGELARRVGHASAARAVGNALGANPVPLLLPCHRVVRGDGTRGHYLFGVELKARLLELERENPALVGCTSTRIFCRRGCPHDRRVGEQRRVVFASPGDARSVGYRPCRVCRPEATLVGSSA